MLEPPWAGEGSVVLFMLHLTMWAAQTGWAALTGRAGGRPPSTHEAGARGAGGTSVSYVSFCHCFVGSCIVFLVLMFVFALRLLSLDSA